MIYTKQPLCPSEYKNLTFPFTEQNKDYFLESLEKKSYTSYGKNVSPSGWTDYEV